MSGQIFISYRRDDAPHAAARLLDNILRRIPRSRVFMDIDNLDPGEIFSDKIKKYVESCDILLAVIGRNWLDARDRDGIRRLDNPDDFVRLEISVALKRGIRVIPVLVDGAQMPTRTNLPDDLQAIVDRHAVEVSHNTFTAGSERIINAIERAGQKKQPGSKPQKRVAEDREEPSIPLQFKFGQALQLLQKWSFVPFVAVLISWFFPVFGGENFYQFLWMMLRADAFSVLIPTSWPVIVLCLHFFAFRWKGFLDAIFSWAGFIASIMYVRGSGYSLEPTIYLWCVFLYKDRIGHPLP